MSPRPNSQRSQIIRTQCGVSHPPPVYRVQCLNRELSIPSLTPRWPTAAHHENPSFDSLFDEVLSTTLVRPTYKAIRLDLERVCQVFWGNSSAMDTDSFNSSDVYMPTITRIKKSDFYFIHSSAIWLVVKIKVKIYFEGNLWRFLMFDERLNIRVAI